MQQSFLLFGLYGMKVGFVYIVFCFSIGTCTKIYKGIKRIESIVGLPLVNDYE